MGGGAGGARVLLLEKARIRRYKPCGGGITARARAASLSYRYPNVVVRLAADDPALRETNTAAVSGTADYRSLVQHMARKAPALLRAVLTRDHAAA